ncbi:MAG: hypothetical protein ACRDLP_03550 [Solirubrobacteraceae bacterium]
MSTSKSEPAASGGDRSAGSDAALQRALADAIEAYALRVREHGQIPPFPPDREVMPTDVAITAAAILKAAEVYSFEIAAMFNV